MRLYVGGEKVTIRRENLVGEVRQFAPGERIMDSEQAGEQIGLLTEGVLKMHLNSAEGKERIISFLRPLSIFGEVTLLTGRKFTPQLEITPITSVKVVFATEKEILRGLREDPEMAIFLLHASCEKVASLISHLNGDSFQDTVSMVSDVLLALGAEQGQIHLSHEEIAEIVGRNRVTVSKAMRQLQALGAIAQKKRAITILREPLLQQIRDGSR